MRLKVALIAILLFVICVAIFPWGYRGYTAGDAMPAEYLPISILREGDLDFDEFVSDKRPERLPFWFKERNGRIITFYPIVSGLMNTPTYWVAENVFGVQDLMKERNRLSMWTATIVSAASVAFMFVGLSFVTKRLWVAVMFALFYAFATPVWSVTSRVMWQHGPALFWLTAGLALLLSKSPRWMPWCGFFFGMAVWTRPTTIVFALPVALYMLMNHRNRRTLIPFAISASIPAILMCIYSQLFWGSILALGQGHGWGNQEQSAAGPHAKFTYNFWPAMAGMLVSPARGLFVFTPPFLFSCVVGFYSFFTRKLDPLYKYLFAGVLLHLIVYANWQSWEGGHSFAYRLLIEVVPALTLLLAVAWELWIQRSIVMQLVFWPLTVVSMYFHFLGAVYYPSNFNTAGGDLPARCWQIEDTELLRLQRKMIHGKE